MEQRILREIIIALVTALGAEIQPLILQKTEGTSGGFFILKGIRTRRERLLLQACYFVLLAAVV